MGRYLALILDPIDVVVTPDNEREVYAAYDAFTQSVREAGVLVGGEALHGVETAVSVTAPDGKVQVLDSPYAEAKEAVGGYYLLECADLDEAIAWAAKIPAAWQHGRVEVRPVVDFS